MPPVHTTVSRIIYTWYFVYKYTTKPVPPKTVADTNTFRPTNYHNDDGGIVYLGAVLLECLHSGRVLRPRRDAQVQGGGRGGREPGSQQSRTSKRMK